MVPPRSNALKRGSLGFARTTQLPSSLWGRILHPPPPALKIPFWGWGGDKRGGVESSCRVGPQNIRPHPTPLRKSRLARNGGRGGYTISPWILCVSRGVPGVLVFMGQRSHASGFFGLYLLHLFLSRSRDAASGTLPSALPVSWHFLQQSRTTIRTDLIIKRILKDPEPPAILFLRSYLIV